MMATRSIMGGNLGLPAGGWRWAALGFVLLALAAAGLAVATPEAARWAGVALLCGIGAVGSLFLYAVWPRESMSAADARRIAEAAARANVAWAITGSRRRGARLQRRLSPHGGRAPKAKPPRRPNWPWRENLRRRCFIG